MDRHGLVYFVLVANGDMGKPEETLGQHLAVRVRDEEQKVAGHSVEAQLQEGTHPRPNDAWVSAYQTKLVATSSVHNHATYIE